MSTETVRWLLGLPPGHYHTEQGSKVEISGTHGGIRDIDFDRWSEETCLECRSIRVYDGELAWSCEACGGGHAKLIPDEKRVE